VISDFINLTMDLNPVSTEIWIPKFLAKYIGYKTDILIVASRVIVCFLPFWIINQYNQLKEEIVSALKSNCNVLIYPADTSPALDTIMKLTFLEKKNIHFGSKASYNKVERFVFSQMKNYRNEVPEAIMKKFRTNLNRILNQFVRKFAIQNVSKSIKVVVLATVQKNPLGAEKTLFGMDAVFVGINETN